MGARSIKSSLIMNNLTQYPEPPNPDAVILGPGGSFKVPESLAGFQGWAFYEDGRGWDGPYWQHGECPRAIYAARRDSDVVRLNIPDHLDIDGDPPDHRTYRHEEAEDLPPEKTSPVAKSGLPPYFQEDVTVEEHEADLGAFLNAMEKQHPKDVFRECDKCESLGAQLVCGDTGQCCAENGERKFLHLAAQGLKPLTDEEVQRWADTAFTKFTTPPLAGSGKGEAGTPRGMRECHRTFMEMFPWLDKQFSSYDEWIVSDDDHARSFRQGWAANTRALASARAEIEDIRTFAQKLQDDVRSLCGTPVGVSTRDGISLLKAEIERLRGAPVTIDGRNFKTPLEASLHLLWLLQRLSYYEPHREGMPADGPRFRQGIIESRKLLSTIGYMKEATNAGGSGE